MEGGGEGLRGFGIRKQVSGKLLDDELIELHVQVERIDHPISPRPASAQVRLSMLCVRPMAGETVLRQNRPDVPIVGRI